MKDMKERIQEALTEVDAEFIDESAPSTDDDAEKPRKKGRTLVYVLIAAAAVLLLTAVTVTTVLYLRDRPPAGSDVPLPGETADMSAEASSPPADSTPKEGEPAGTPGQTGDQTAEDETMPLAESETPAETEPMEEPTEGPTEDVVYSYVTADWPKYKDARELVNAAANVYRGKVVGIAFETLDLITGQRDVKREDNDVMLYTVYKIEATETLKGEEKEYRYIKAIGGIEGEYINEQTEALEKAGLDPAAGIAVCESVDKLTQGETYLFVTGDGTTEYEPILNGSQFAYQGANAWEIAILSAIEGLI